MKVKTYRSRSLQEALTHIKQDLGSDALILSTRPVSRPKPLNLFSPPKWEVTAALKEASDGVPPTAQPSSVVSGPSLRTRDEFAPGSVPVSRGESTGKGQVRANRVTPGAVLSAAAAPAPIRDRRIDELLEEMDELKRSVRLIGKVLPAGKTAGPANSVYNELVGQGIDSDIAEQLVAAASRGNPTGIEVRERVQRLIADMLVIEKPAEFQATGRIVSVFVGPTGVGKTTTIAKIAGHAKARFKKKVVMVSTDVFRVGGQEQLYRFGTLLGIPVYPCSDVATLKNLIESFNDVDLVLVDTPGASPSDLARLTKLEAALTAPGARVNLVISATTRSEDVSRIIKRYQRFSPKRVVLTKIDETDSKGAMVGDLLRNELAISYLTNGQRVPEDLLLSSAVELASYVLPSETRRFE